MLHEFYDDVGGGFHCPDCTSYLTVTFGVLDRGKGRMVFLAKCEECEANGLPCQVKGYIMLDEKVFEEAMLSGMIWTETEEAA